MSFLDTLLGRKTHLDFSSIEEWLEADELPSNFTEIKDTKKRDKLLTKMGELRKKLWLNHLALLSDDDRRKIDQNKHPSQSWKLVDEAESYAQQFRQELGDNQWVTEIHVDRLPVDRQVMVVTLSRNMLPSVYRRFIPTFFRGFEVKVATARRRAGVR